MRQTTKNQQFSVVLGTGGHDLTYLTVSCKGFNKRLPVSVGLGTTRKIVTESTRNPTSFNKLPVL